MKNGIYLTKRWNKDMKWKSIYAKAKCLVQVVQKDQGYMAKCLTCSWQSAVGKLSPTSAQGRNHALGRDSQ